MSGLVLKTVEVPKNFLDPKSLQVAVENSLTQTAKAVKVDFDVTTRTWKKRPTFKIKSQTGRREISTDDTVYKFVDGGTKAHPIKPRRAKALRYQGKYKAKTRVRVIGSSGGGKSGAFVVRKSVKHPGTKARKFSDEIGKKWVKLYPKQIQRSIDAVLK